MEENITGGVSPLKKWKGRRGKSGGTTGDTRYKRDKWVPPASGGTIKTPGATKPYTINNGKVEPSSANADASASANSNGRSGHYEDTYKDVTTKTLKERSSYQDSYDGMEDRGGQKYNKRSGCGMMDHLARVQVHPQARHLARKC